MNMIIKFYKELIIIVLLILLTFFWQRYVTKNDELESIKFQQDLTQQLNDINSKISEIQEREKYLYPKIDTNIALINKNIKLTKERLDSIEKNIPKKELIYDDFKKKDINKISVYLLANGYSNSIINSECQ